MGPLSLPRCHNITMMAFSSFPVEFSCPYQTSSLMPYSESSSELVISNLLQYSRSAIACFSKLLEKSTTFQFQAGLMFIAMTYSH